MLAKESKVRTLIYQRDFIQMQLEILWSDGNPAFLYPGYLYPENKKYFEEEGYNITTFRGTEASAILEGEIIVNLFTPADEIILDEIDVCVSEGWSADMKETPEFAEIWQNDFFENNEEE